MDIDRTRRRLLAGSVGIAAVGLAGCIDEAVEIADDTAEDGAEDGTDDVDDGVGDDDDPENAALGDTVELGQTDSVAFEMRSLDPELDLRFGGRIHEGNFYYEYDVEDGIVEYYYVDGTFYMVMEGFCIANPGDEEDPAEVDPEDEFAIDTHETEIEDHSDLEWVDRDEIDGVPVYVYELGPEADLTYYVETETGLLRRVETTEFVIDYFDWGAVDPVSAPDMDCIEY